ncbi:peptide-methionine (S)-S-oxide reductase MsrA [Verrucomicrobiales bacterium]|nr:peptide-methionine (S)-S-oxide reductase MsrA [Verrucomicrobiales bacterium]
MMKRIKTLKLLALFLAIAFGVPTWSFSADPEKKGKDVEVSAESLATATFGAGCFWCVEEVFEQTKGVKTVVSGFMGGTPETADYKFISRGGTDHAEVVQITYDPETLTYEKLLDVLFDSHDPTQLNRQGPDRGRHYRSVIFYHDDLQKLAAEKKIKDLTDKKSFWGRDIVTEVTEALPFYPATEDHQDFAKRNPGHPYLENVLYPKLKKLEMEVPK